MASATERLGTILRTQDRVGLRFVRHLRHSPDRVWRALTDRDQLQHWFPTDMVELAWEQELLRYELEADGDHTVLTLTVWLGDPLAHGPDGSPDEASRTASAAAGYHTCLEHLEALLDERDLGSLHQADTGALEAEYRTMV